MSVPTTAGQQACIDGDLGALVAALEHGEEVDSADETFGNTLLTLAAYNGHPSLVRELLAHGADIEARCRAKNTPLMKAAWGGNLECVEMLLEAGADLEAKEEKGYSALFVAVGFNRLEVARLLLERGAAVDLVESEGFSMLGHAVYESDEGMAKLLSSRGVRDVRPAWAQRERAEVGCNLDMDHVVSYLQAIVHSVESGFGGSESRALEQEVRAMNLDEEFDRAFDVTFGGGKEARLTIAFFLDDIDAPDVSVFTRADLAEEIERRAEAELSD